MSVTLTNLALGGLFLYGLKPKSESKDDKIDIYRQRDMQGLNSDTQDIIELITFSDNTDPVGSFKYKVHKYPGDIDIFEPVKICCNRNQATEKITTELRNIANKVKRSKTVFWGDFKAGIDYELKPKADTSSSDYAELLRSVGVPRSEISEALSNYPESARNMYIVRWNEDQILAGQQQLRSGKILTLGEAITHDSIVKLDLWATVEGNYTEITNFFLFVMLDTDGNESVLNAPLGDRLESLNLDIQKYGSKEHWNPLKLAKRLWNKALYIKDHKMTKKLYPLFSSGAAQLNQIIGESETIRFMTEQLSTEQLQGVDRKLRTQIRGFKRRINDVDDLDLGPLETKLYAILDKAATGPPPVRVSQLLEIEDTLQTFVNTYSESYLRSIGINPN